MKKYLWTESLFISCALLGWGYGTDRLLLSLMMALILMLFTCSPWRNDPQENTKSRTNDVTLILLVVSSLWVYTQRQTFQDNWARHLLALFPALFFPKLAFNAIQIGGPLRASGPPKDGAAIAKNWMNQHWTYSRRSLDALNPLTFETIYFFITVFISSLSLPWKIGTPSCLALLSAYCLISSESYLRKKTKALLSTLVCVLTLSASLLGALGLEWLQNYAEDYLLQMWTHTADPRQNVDSMETAIGRKGQLFNGNRLIARIEWDQDRGYIRDGLYSFTTNGSTWYSTSSPSTRTSHLIYSSSDGGSFSLAAAGSKKSGQTAQAKISMTFSKDKTPIPLPRGAQDLFGLPMSRLDLTEMGIPVASGSPGFTKFGVTYSPHHDTQPGPIPDDVGIPPQYLRDLDAFILASGALGLAPPQAAEVIARYFRAHWSYTLNLETRQGTPRTLSQFLRSDHQGHCEYFAAVTTLALRRLGIPARYETGFQVHEYNEHEKLFWIRARDAHAWSTFWDGQSWHIADSTPPGLSDALGWSDYGLDMLARLQYFIDALDTAALFNNIPSWALWSAFLCGALYFGYKIRFKSHKIDPLGSPESLRLCLKLEKITGLTRSNLETASDFWRRCAPFTQQQNLLLVLADEREMAVFSSSGDLDALSRCESYARDIVSKI